MSDYPEIKEKDVELIFLNERVFNVPESIIDVRLNLSNDIDILGTIIQTARYVRKDGYTDEVEIKSSIKITMPFVILKHSLKPGSIIKRSDVTTVIKKVSRMSPYYFHDINNVIGLEAVSPLRKNQILSSHLLQRPLDIKQGDQIRVIITRSGLEITTLGTTLDNGYIGDTIRIRLSLGDKKIMKGKVINADTVQILSRF